MTKVLILGSSGTLGYQLYKKLNQFDKIKVYHTGLKKRKIDICKKNELDRFIISINPDLIVNCIAYTNIEKCEYNKLLSKKINFEIVKEIMKIKVKKRLKFNFIHFSTDQFYNRRGKKPSHENSEIFLINNYCKHKRMAELESLKHKSLIFRTNFFGRSKKDKTFSDWIFNSFKRKKKIYLFNDVYFNPLRINTIVKIICLIIIKKKYIYSGIYNLGSKSGILKNEFAKFFAKKTNVINENFENINVNNLLKVKRSNNMFMNVGKFEKKFKFKLPEINYEIANEAKNYLPNIKFKHTKNN